MLTQDEETKSSAQKSSHYSRKRARQKPVGHSEMFSGAQGFFPLAGSHLYIFYPQVWIKQVLEEGPQIRPRNVE